MFETIFTWRRTIARHERGPMAEERRRYLRHLKERGLSRESLHRYAVYALCVVRWLKLTPDRRVSLDEVDAAAERWTHRRRPWNLHAKGLRAGRKLFRMVARDWLRFLNLLIPPTPWSNPYAPLAGRGKRPLRRHSLTVTAP